MIQKSSIWNTAGIFFNYPTNEHYLLEMSREIDLAHTSLKQNLNQLINEGIIKEKVNKRGNRKYPVYKADTDSQAYRQAKRAYNITTLLDSGLIQHLDDSLMPKCIVLFGSYARGEDVEESDIDIFIECKEQTMDLARYEKALKRKIQLHFKKSFKDIPNEMKNSIINGIVLKGFLEAFK
ncbi:MAG: nucleotidyltransferase domain-containing protein [Nanoarchaeota archaeon]|nr:nucleotidyltransferase domain-containing protein [Nanoarchaeota archaeon]